jgi:3-oxoacyl-[acyl-carrier-protein] synthase III
MAQTKVDGVVLRGISSCVTCSTASIADDNADFSSEEVLRVVKLAGVKERHVVSDQICTSDLCYEAARRLMSHLGWQPETINLLVFVSQTPDYFMPTTACILQHRLGLSTDCAAFDVNLGCSGFPYGLCIVSKMMQGAGFNRALLLVGETPSKICYPADRATRLIFGDAGTASALEIDPGGGPMGFVLHTDGHGANDFFVHAGGFRDRFCQEERQHYIQMNGANIFAFTMNRVPALISEALLLAGWNADEVDYYVFHQANAFIIEHLRKKVGVPREKVPTVIERFGNTGGCSVPLVLTQGELLVKENRSLKLVLLGFGVGLSWASATLELPSDTPRLHFALDNM